MSQRADHLVEAAISAPSKDDRIAADIRSALMRDADLDSSRINVEVCKGQVVLAGVVPTGWAKIQAGEDARWTPGVTSVINDLTVAPRGLREDATLAIEIERALRRDSAVNADNIDVTVERRRATLSGIVRSWAERNAALEDALHVPGIVDVRDGLSIRGGET